MTQIHHSSEKIILEVEQTFQYIFPLWNKKIVLTWKCMHFILIFMDKNNLIYKTKDLGTFQCPVPTLGPDHVA